MLTLPALFNNQPNFASITQVAPIIEGRCFRPRPKGLDILFTDFCHPSSDFCCLSSDFCHLSGLRKFSSLLPFHVGSGNSPCCRFFGIGGRATGMPFGGFVWRSLNMPRWPRAITRACENTNGLHKKEKAASTRQDDREDQKEANRLRYTCTVNS